MLEIERRHPDQPPARGGPVARVAWGLLVALGLVLPFEAPLFSVGPLVITSAELMLYLAIAAWGVSLLIGNGGQGTLAGRVRTGIADIRRLARDPVARAVVLWLAVTVVSAVAAPAGRGQAAKFALRAVSGGLVYFVARAQVRWPGRALALALAIAAGGAVSAALALVEALRPDWTWWWRPFRQQEFMVLGLRRASGTFAFPNIAAMYWEAALPLLALPLLSPLAGAGAGLPAGPRARRGRPGAVVFGVASVFVLALLASATRAALVGAAVACCVLFAVGRRAGPAVGQGVRRFAGAVLALELVLLVVALARGGQASPLAQRLFWWRAGDWYGARYAALAGPVAATAGQRLRIPVTVTNTGLAAWPARDAGEVTLGYHWQVGAPRPLDRREPVGLRTRLPRAIGHGETVTIAAEADVPPVPGRYWLRWDLIADYASDNNVTWFSEVGSATGDQIVDVVAPAAPPVGPPPAPAGDVAPLPSRRQLWIAAIRLWRRHPLLGVGPDAFRHRYAEVIAPAPGVRFDDDRMHANNLYFETLADLGLAGVLALALLAGALARAARAAWRAGDVGLPALVAAAALAAYFVHGLADTFLAFTPTMAQWWLLVALAGTAPLCDLEPSKGSRPPTMKPTGQSPLGFDAPSSPTRTTP